MRNATRLIGATSAQPNDSVHNGGQFSGDRPRGIAALALAGLFGLLNSVACSSSSSSAAKQDASLPDTSADQQQVPDTWVAPDVITPIGLDASVDTPVDAPVDAFVDASASPPVDAHVDAFVDAHVDAPVDAPVDASVDAPVGASADAPTNAPLDAAVDALVPEPVDAFVCTPADGGMPGTICGPEQVCNGGICQSACGVGQTLCPEGACHDLMNESANCGWCGSECSSDKQCVGGNCTCIVPGTCPL